MPFRPLLLWDILYIVLVEEKIISQKFVSHNYTEFNQQWNVFSAFNPSKCTHTWSSGHTHTHKPGAVDTHTPGAVGTHTHTHTPGAVGTHTHTPGAVGTHTHTHTHLEQWAHTHTHTWSSGHTHTHTHLEQWAHTQTQTHTHSEQPTLRRPGCSWGFGALLRGLRDSNPQPQVTSKTLYPLGPRLPLGIQNMLHVTQFLTGQMSFSTAGFYALWSICKCTVHTFVSVIYCQCTLGQQRVWISQITHILSTSILCWGYVKTHLNMLTEQILQKWLWMHISKTCLKETS